MKHRKTEDPSKENKPEITLRSAIHLFQKAQVSAYAAQAAFFVLLSLTPFCAFLTAVLRYLPWGAEPPTSWIGSMLFSALGDGSTPSAALLSISALTALWSASRGIVALTRGLNEMYGLRETRSYVKLRFFALAETLILELALICTLAGTVWGEQFRNALGVRGIWADGLRAGSGFLLLTVFFLFLYAILPDHSTRISRHLTGAAAAAGGWLAFTRAYTFYTEQVADFSRIYGTLSNIAMLMLWLYLCLYILFLGALLNRLLWEL